MTEFLIKWVFQDNSLLTLSKSRDELHALNRCLYISGNSGTQLPYKDYADEHDSIIIIGDLIPGRGEVINFDFLVKQIKANTVHRLSGIFYLIHVSEGKKISIFSSLFSILPIYYSVQGGTAHVASCTTLIREIMGVEPQIDKRYLLERVLFNYGVFNRTYWKGISLVPSNHCISLDSQLNITKIFEISDLYQSQIKKGKRVLNQLADLFIENSRKYFPDERYALAFTGGFDGRTLLAASLYHTMDFTAFSFGPSDSDDLYLPRKQAAKLNVDFIPILLEDEYIRQHSYKDGLDLINLTEGCASFSRAHYLYAARKLSEDYRYMITGNFGSEVFRAAHVVGVMMSEDLYRVIGCTNTAEIKPLILASRKLEFLNRNEFKHEIESLVAELETYRKNNSKLDANGLLYKFTFTETLRKYFGPEIVMQRRFICNRTPYLDYQLIEFLLTTYYCGAYSDFNTHNPAKRFKGQVAYAHIIRKAFPQLYNMTTNKGYQPRDLINPLGKIKLMESFIGKKLTRNKNTHLDPYSVLKAYEINHEKYLKWPLMHNLYNVSLIKSCLDKPPDVINRGTVFNLLSSNYYLQSVLGDNE